MGLLPQEVWAEIAPVFARCFPREGVVAVMPDLTWRELENTAANPLNDFNISLDDLAELIDNPPLALIHSHPNGHQEPSDADTISQLRYGWTWGISVVNGNSNTGEIFSVGYPEFWGDDLPIQPLLGRRYLWAVRDCWTLCRDYYRLKGFALKDVPRSREPGLYPAGHPQRTPFRTYPPLVGFEPVGRLDRKPGDFLTLCWRDNEPNHCAIYLGNSTLLHQPRDQNSSEWQVNSERTLYENMSAQFYRLKGSNGGNS